MAWVDLSGAFGYGTKLTSTQMQNLRDNLTALANGDGGSPKIKTAAIDANQVTYPKLKITVQEQSQLINAGANHQFTLTGGGYCFLPHHKSSVGNPAEIKLYTGTLSTSYAGPFVNIKNTHSVVNATFYCRHTYITSSGEIFWLFLLVDKATDEIIGMSACPDHPSFGHKIEPDELPHPFLNYDEGKHQIMLANPDFELVEKVRKDSPDCLLDGFINLCELKDGGRWPDKEVSLDHKRKKKIPKLNYVKMMELKWNG